MALEQREISREKIVLMVSIPSRAQGDSQDLGSLGYRASCRRIFAGYVMDVFQFETNSKQ